MQPRTPPTRIQEAASAQGYVEDHARALAIVDRLRAARDPAAAREATRHAAAFLEPHMAEEEAPDGVFPWVCALEPGLSADVGRLMYEHDEIRDALRGIAEAEDADVLSRVASLADRLEAHEAAERVALERAVRVR